MDQNYIAPVAHGVLPEILREILTFPRAGAILIFKQLCYNIAENHIEEVKVLGNEKEKSARTGEGDHAGQGFVCLRYALLGEGL